MKSPKINQRLYIPFILLCVVNAAGLQAETLMPGQYLVWGISSEDVQIPAGSVITEAVLTITGIEPAGSSFYVYLLDDPLVNIEVETNLQPEQDVFSGYGEALTGTVQNGNWVCRLSDVDDLNSDVWEYFTYPFYFSLADGSQIRYSSALLKLIDFVGNGKNFGMGLEPAAGSSFSCNSIGLDLTVAAYEGSASQTTISLQMGTLLKSKFKLPDYNKDGKSDLLWHNTATGIHTATLMNGLVKVQEGGFGGNKDNWQIIGAGDFNGDGKTDLLWRHTLTGGHSISLLDGLVRIQDLGIGGSLEWKIIGLADFNGDGKSDLLWRQTSTGIHVATLMNGVTKIQDGGLGGNKANWQIAGMGDFNGDGKTDLVWRHVATGGYLATLMNGLTKVQEVSLGGSLEWRIVGLADFNGDGKSDLVWRQTSTGAHMATLMDGLTRIRDGSLGGNKDNWQAVEVGDFNGDGKSDLLWRHTVTGGHSIAIMDGLTKIQDLGIGGSLEWKIIELNDFNGDGKSDLLWRQTSTGAHMATLMDGLTKVQQASLGGNHDWHIVGLGIEGAEIMGSAPDLFRSGF